MSFLDDVKRDAERARSVPEGVVASFRGFIQHVMEALHKDDVDHARELLDEGHRRAPEMATAVMANVSAPGDAQGGVDVDHAGGQALTDPNLTRTTSEAQPIEPAVEEERRAGEVDERSDPVERRMT